MDPVDKPRKVVGIYDRPEQARRIPRWLAVLAVLLALGWIAYLAFAH